MYSFHKIKAAAAMLMVGILLALAITATAQADGGTRQGLTAEQSKAVRARAEAMDRYYHLGSYSVIEASSPFQWSDAGIGAGAMLGTILVAGGLAVALRRRGAGKPSFPTTT